MDACNEIDQVSFLNLGLDANRRALYSLPSWQIFGGRTVTITTCQHRRCRKTIENISPFTVLTLEVHGHAEPNMNSLLNAHLQEEDLRDPDDKCEGCNRFQCRKKQTRIEVWPNVLVLHLKRWQQSRSGSWIRDGRFIEFADVLDDMLDAPRYRLTAVVCHSGFKGSGHYIAYCAGNNGDWYLTDDSSKPKRVLLQEVLHAIPYILMYVQDVGECLVKS